MNEQPNSQNPALQGIAAAALGRQLEATMQPTWKAAFERAGALDGIKASLAHHPAFRIENPALQGIAAAALGRQLEATMQPTWKAAFERAGALDGIKASLAHHPAFRIENPALQGIAAAALGRQLEATMQPTWKAAFERHPVFTGSYTLGVKGAIASAMGAFEVQRRSFDALLAGSGRRGLFAAQIGQLVATQVSIARLATGSGVLESGPLAVSSARLAEATASIGSFIAADRVTLLRGLTRQSSKILDAYLDGLPAAPIARRAAAARFGADAQTGLVIAESLTSSDLDDDSRHELAEQYTAEVIQPWESAPARAREALLEKLRSVRPDLPDYIRGAWDDIERNGPKAGMKIASCAVECIDHTLRTLADEDSVRAWMQSEGAKSGWTTDDDRLTRRVRIEFVMREQSQRDTKLARSSVESLITLFQNVMDVLQNAKHGDAPEMTIMCSLVLTAEAALSQLLAGY